MKMMMKVGKLTVTTVINIITVSFVNPFDLISYQNDLDTTEPALVQQTSQVSGKTEEEGLQESKKVQAPSRLDQIQGDTERLPDYTQKCQEFVCTRHGQRHWLQQ